MSVLSNLRQRLTKEILGGRFRNRKKAKTLSAESGHFVLEALEPRLLLAADPFAIAGTVSAVTPPTAVLTAAAQADPAFVQVNQATPQTNQSTVTVSYASAQSAS